VAVLAGREHDYERTARPLVHALELTHHFDIEVVSDFAAANSEKAKVVIAASDVPLESSEAERLIAFVRRGGGLILLHGTLATWSHDSSVAAMAGWTAGGPGPMTDRENGGGSPSHRPIACRDRARRRALPFRGSSCRS